MGERDPQTLEISGVQEEVGTEGVSKPESWEATTSMHYPKPVFLTQVLEDVAKWSTFSFVIDPSLNRPLQIFAPHRMSKDQALELFIASLESIGLRLIELEGGIMKIVGEKPKHIVA